ncbi:MAG: 50S ribosomal protein L9 [Zavarzinella sp.]
MAKAKQPQLPKPKKKLRKRNQVQKGKNGGTLLVLVEDVLHVGRQGDLVEVRPGYARNYLLPQGLATIPTAHNLQQLERYKIRVTQMKEARIADLKAIAEQIIRTRSVTIESHANENGHLYGSVGAVEITKALRGKNLLVEADMIRLETPIKECGIYSSIRIALGFDIESNIEVVVIPETAARR